MLPTPDSVVAFYLVSPTGDIWVREQLKDGESRADMLPGLPEVTGLILIGQCFS